MRSDNHRKVRASHLKRNACLYIRQSTLRQVLHNTESTKRQYALRDRAVALGWAMDQVVVIDSDLGQSGAAVDREGFKRLVADVGTGKVGIVLGLEVSRLARNSSDWCRLTEICALTDTLILDEDGIYDPTDFNDRLLLGLKGTMSEAELHMLRTRMRGGLLSKARRGELKVRLPIGFVYGPDERVILDPDQQIQQAVSTLFDTFSRTGSAFKTVQEFRKRGLMFPRRIHGGPRAGEVIWAELIHSTALRILRNPRYAGAFCFGRRQNMRNPNGKVVAFPKPRDQWHAFIPDAHPGYITWEQHEANLRRLQENSTARSSHERKVPPREGPALLQGLVICGICGERMTVNYHSRRGSLVPDYICTRKAIEQGRTRICQRVQGKDLDNRIGEILVEAVTPMALEVAMAVQKELSDRAREADRLRQQQVERARYEAHLARRRYMRVDPDNRLVAGALEAEWNQKLRELSEAQEEYERKRIEDQYLLDEKRRERIMSLAKDFPRLWKDPRTPHREKKRMVRLLIEDVTLIKTDAITAHIRFRGGANRSLKLPVPLPATKLRVTNSEVIEEIDRLLDHHTYSGVARVLNEKGITTFEGKPFTAAAVGRLRRGHRLKDRFDRLRSRGFLSAQELAERFGIEVEAVKELRVKGVVTCHPYNDIAEYLYEPPDDKVLEMECNVQHVNGEYRQVISECVPRGAV